MSDFVFVGNTPVDSGKIAELKEVGISSAYLGPEAFDIHGRHLPGYRPVMIARSELSLYDQHMMRKFREVS